MAEAEQLLHGCHFQSHTGVRAMRLIDADALKADYGMKDDCADCEKELQGTVRSCEYDRIYSKMDFLRMDR